MFPKAPVLVARFLGCVWVWVWVWDVIGGVLSGEMRGDRPDGRPGLLLQVAGVSGIRPDAVRGGEGMCLSDVESTLMRWDPLPKLLLS